MTSLKSNLYAALTTQNTTGHDCTTTHAKNTTTLRPNVFLTEIHRLLVTNKGRSAFPSANHCQGQLQPPQSVTVQALQVARLAGRLFNDANTASAIKSRKMRAEKKYELKVLVRKPEGE